MVLWLLAAVAILIYGALGLPFDESQQLTAQDRSLSVLGHGPLWKPYRMPNPNPTITCSTCDASYDCTPLFDWQYYTAHYPDIDAKNAKEAKEHWVAYGMAQGRKQHAGHKVFKIILMTKDEWPLLRSWVLHHSYVFGGSNLYIIDASTRPEIIAFLKDASTRLGVHVMHSHADLNGVLAEVNQLMANLGPACDFITKLDTDEFIIVHNKDKDVFQVEGILDYVDTMVEDGSKFKMGYIMDMAVPAEGCSIDDDPALETGFTNPQMPFMKAIFPGFAFERTDLGNHYGTVKAQFSKPQEEDLLSELAILHFHYQCYDTFMANTYRAVLSHKYVDAGDSKEVMIQKCEKLVGGYKGRECLVASCHKVWTYLDHLYNEKESRDTYYANGVKTARTITDLRVELIHLTAFYDYT